MLLLSCVAAGQKMDATKSSASTSVLSRSTLLSTVSSPVCGWQYHLAYEREKLNELRRQVAAQEERFTALQQQFEKFSSNSDTPGCPSFFS